MITLRLYLSAPKIDRADIRDDTEPKAKAIVIETGFVEIGIWNKPATRLLIRATKGVARDKDWLIKNAPTIRLLKKRARAKIRKELTSEFQGRLKGYEHTISEMSEKNSKLFNDVRALQRVFRIVSNPPGESDE